MRAWRSSRPLSDDELDELADEVDRRYTGQLQLLGEDGTVRPLTNLEMLASSRKWKKLNQEARVYQRFVVAVEEWIDAGCPFAMGESDEYSYDSASV